MSDEFPFDLGPKERTEGKFKKVAEFRMEDSLLDFVFEYRGLRLMIDFALEVATGEDPEQAFTKTEIAERSGIARKTVYEYIDRLVEVNVFEQIGTRSPQYRVQQSDTVDALLHLHRTLDESFEDGDR